MFSIVICSHNKVRSLEAILNSLHVISGSVPFEVIVIADGPTDATMSMLEGQRTDYPLNYYEIEHSGLAQARNVGIRRSRGSHVVFCDDDVLLHPDYLQRLSEAVALNPGYVHIGNLLNISKECTGRIVDGLIDHQFPDYDSLHQCQEPHIFFEAAKQLFFYRNEYTDFHPASWWAVVTGGNLCIPKALFDVAGYFDPAIKGWGPEDADLCYRFFLQGIKACYNAGCLLYHLDHPRNNATLLDSMTRNAVYFIKKYKKPPELYDYLNFTNGKLSLSEFNDRCSDLYKMEKYTIPDFSMSMKDYSGKERILKFDL